LKTNIELVRKKSNWNYDIYFKLWQNYLKAEYSYNNSKIVSISLLDNKDLKKEFKISNIDLKLSDINSETLNWLRSDLISFLKKYNREIVEKYLKSQKR